MPHARAYWVARSGVGELRGEDVPAEPGAGKSLLRAEFSGVSTGACIGHIAPEALAGGPVGKVQDGDIIQIIIDCNKLEGSVDLIGESKTPTNQRSIELGTRILAKRQLRSDLAPRPDLPDDTRLWAALQQTGGGTWSGCVFDVDAIIEKLNTGKETTPKK